MIFPFFSAICLLCMNILGDQLHTQLHTLAQTTWNNEYMIEMTQRFTLQPFEYPEFTIIQSSNLSKNLQYQSLYSWYSHSNHPYDIVINSWNNYNIQAHESLLEACDLLMNYKMDFLPFDIYEYIDITEREREKKIESERNSENTFNWIVQYTTPFLNPTSHKYPLPTFEEDTINKIEYLSYRELHGIYKEKREKYLNHLCSFELSDFSLLFYNKTSQKLQFRLNNYNLLKIILKNILTFANLETMKKMPKYNGIQVLYEKSKFLMSLLNKLERITFETIRYGNIGVKTVEEYSDKMLKSWPKFIEDIQKAFLMTPLSQLQNEKEKYFVQEKMDEWTIKREHETLYTKIKSIQLDISWQDYSLPLLQNIQYWTTEFTTLFDTIIQYMKSVTIQLLVLLCGTYIFLSTVCTTVNKWISSFIKYPSTVYHKKYE